MKIVLFLGAAVAKNFGFQWAPEGPDASGNLQVMADARLNMGSSGVFSLMEKMMTEEEEMKKKSEELGHLVTAREMNQMKLEEEIRRQDHEDEVAEEYQKLAQTVENEEQKFGYDATNMAKFNKEERKQILKGFESEDTQKMTEEMLDSALKDL